MEMCWEYWRTELETSTIKCPTTLTIAALGYFLLDPFHSYDPNPNSFNDSLNFSDYPPQPQYQTYSCELCRNDAHYGYDCPPQVPFLKQEDQAAKVSSQYWKPPIFLMTKNDYDEENFTSSNDESFSEEDVPKENFKIYSNPLFEFDEEIISKSLLNRDTSMVSSLKIDSLLEEFSGKLAHIDSIPPGIDEADFDPEDDIRLVEKLLYDNSSPRPSKELNSEIPDAIIESFSPTHIPVKDSDSLMEEIDIFLAPDDSIPPGIENDD
ncbi:hypothetical protein Tco_0168458 [Tanacetum coccineum]